MDANDALSKLLASLRLEHARRHELAQDSTLDFRPRNGGSQIILLEAGRVAWQLRNSKGEIVTYVVEAPAALGAVAELFGVNAGTQSNSQANTLPDMDLSDSLARARANLPYVDAPIRALTGAVLVEKPLKDLWDLRYQDADFCEVLSHLNVLARRAGVDLFLALAQILPSEPFFSDLPHPFERKIHVPFLINRVRTQALWSPLIVSGLPAKQLVVLLSGYARAKYAPFGEGKVVHGMKAPWVVGELERPIGPHGSMETLENVFTIECKAEQEGLACFPYVYYLSLDYAELEDLYIEFPWLEARHSQIVRRRTVRWIPKLAFFGRYKTSIGALLLRYGCDDGRVSIPRVEWNQELNDGRYGVRRLREMANIPEIGISNLSITKTEISFDLDHTLLVKWLSQGGEGES